jgi:hypothetical protein
MLPISASTPERFPAVRHVHLRQRSGTTPSCPPLRRSTQCTRLEEAYAGVLVRRSAPALLFKAVV